MFQLLLLVDAFGMLCYAIVAVASLFDPAHDSIEVAFYFLIGLALVGGGVYAGFVLRRGGRQSRSRIKQLRLLPTWFPLHHRQPQQSMA